MFLPRYVLADENLGHLRKKNKQERPNEVATNQLLYIFVTWIVPVSLESLVV